jgi:predicted RNA-binding protein YlqC (UPF0109 family)
MLHMDIKGLGPCIVQAIVDTPHEVLISAIEGGQTKVLELRVAGTFKRFAQDPFSD